MDGQMDGQAIADGRMYGCNKHNLVTGLKLRSNRLGGSLPLELGFLSNIERLQLGMLSQVLSVG